MDAARGLLLAEQSGFDHFSRMEPATLEFLPQVREMCQQNTCGNYGKCWTCPPACGSLETISKQAAGYRTGILVQSTGQLEDDFDIETMMETERLHKARFRVLVEEVRKEEPGCLPMAAGACEVCQTCAYPEPCRFPERCIPSMEAYGLVVSQVCERAGLPYYYGPKTITYTSCILLDT